MSEKSKKSEYLTPTMFDFKLLSFMFTIFVNIVDPFKIIRRFILKPATSVLMSFYEEYKEKIFDKFDGSQSMICK